MDNNHSSPEQNMTLERLQREHQRQIDDLVRLNEVSQSVVQVLDLDEVLTRIMNVANRMLDVENGSVLLLDETSGELSFANSVSNGKKVNIATRLKKGQGIAGWVVAHGEAVSVNDVSQDARWFGEVEMGFVTRSVLCVPLRHNDRILGAVQALNKRGSDGFTPRDAVLLSTFATSATIAIENARLFQEARQARQLRALNQAALMLNGAMDLESALNTGLEQVFAILKVKAGAIALTDAQSPAAALTVKVSRGLSSDATIAAEQLQAIELLSAQALAHSTPSAGQARGEGETLIIGQKQAAQYPSGRALFDSAFSAFKELAFIPLPFVPLTTGQTGDRAGGVLSVMSDAPHTFTAEKINLLTGLARIIALALQNAFHYAQMQVQTRHLTYLNEIGGALTRSLDLAQVLKVIIEGVNALLETERASVFLIDPDSDELVLRYTNEGDADIRLSPPWGGIAGWVALHDQPALVNDTIGDPRHLRQVAIETGYEAHSILCAPLKIEEQVIGVVQVLNKRGNKQFTHRHLDLLIEFAKWASIALHNARLFDERIQAYQRLSNEQDRRIAAETRGAMAAIVLNMAHTMNNVVGAIRVWASKLERAAHASSPIPISTYAPEIERIQQNAREAIELIGNMTDPLEQPAVAPTDLHRCLSEAIGSCWWPDNVQVQQDYAPDIPFVQANARRLEAVFHNLLSNAIQVLACPERSRRAEEGGTIQVHTRLTAAGDIEVKVSDDGPGIPPELQNHVFKPGFSGKDGGLGIGLWLVETFIHQFDGDISFDSTPDKGATFVVTLKASDENT